MSPPARAEVENPKKLMQDTGEVRCPKLLKRFTSFDSQHFHVTLKFKCLDKREDNLENHSVANHYIRHGEFQSHVLESWVKYRLVLVLGTTLNCRKWAGRKTRAHLFAGQEPAFL